jgi:CubicO group peptidase (beta-lactamase class C family)
MFHRMAPGSLLLLPLWLVSLSSVPDQRSTVEEEFEGQWVGEAVGEEESTYLMVGIYRVGGSLVGSVTLPDPGFVRVEFDSLAVEGRQLFAAASRDTLVLDVSEQEGGWIEGSFQSGGESLPVRLVRSGSPEAGEYAERIGTLVEAFRSDSRLERTVDGGAAARLSGEAIEELVAAADEAFTSSLVIFKDGEPVGEWYRNGISRRIQAMSVTKVTLNLAVGRLLTTGDIESVDTPVHTVVPEWSSGARSRITFRHLLNHTSGLPSGVPANEIYEAPDIEAYSLALEPVHEPGTVMEYNNNATNALAAVIRRVAGIPIDEFIGREIFEPLGITDFTWLRDPSGNPHGMAGLSIHARDLARVGQLVLDQGWWNGESLIDPEWFTKSFQPSAPDVDTEGVLDGRSHTVGLIWFLIRHDLDEPGDSLGDMFGMQHSGDLGQWLVIYPEEGLVGVRMAQFSPAFDAETDLYFAFMDHLHKVAPAAR